MTGDVNALVQMSCEEAMRLIENAVVGELPSASVQKRLNVHLESCEQCGSLSSVLNSFSRFDSVMVKADYSHDIHSVLDRLEVEVATQRRRRALWSALGIAAAFITVIFLGVWFFPDADAPSMVSDTNLCIPEDPVELVPGVFWTRCEGNTAVPHVKGGEARVSLLRGTVALSVNPNRHPRKAVIVETPDGEVRVKGTLFSVHVDNSSSSRVDVYRGGVALIFHDDTKSILQVNAGYGAGTRDGTIVKLVSTEDTPLIDALAAIAETNQEEAKAASSMSGVEQRKPNDATANVKGPEALPNGNTASPVRGETKIQKSMTAQGVAQKKKTESLDTLIDDARSCLLVSNWECAASKYHEVLKKHSRHRESLAVLISLAKLELRHLNRPRQALQHYNSYMAKASNGPLAEDALIGAAKCYARLGLKNEERKVIRRFIRTYPQSTMMDEAQRRLAEIEDNKSP